MIARLALALAVFGLAGCEAILGIPDPGGGDGDTDLPPGEQGDAAPPRGDGGAAIFNPLGLLCGPAHRDNGFDGECGPAEAVCLTQASNFGDPEGATGYCSPLCFGDQGVCMSGYNGPRAEFVACVVNTDGSVDPSAAGEACGIGCPNGDVDCPAGLICQPFDDGAGGTIPACAPDSWLDLGF